MNRLTERMKTIYPFSEVCRGIQNQPHRFNGDFEKPLELSCIESEVISLDSVQSLELFFSPCRAETHSNSQTAKEDIQENFHRSSKILPQGDPYIAPSTER